MPQCFRGFPAPALVRAFLAKVVVAASTQPRPSTELLGTYEIAQLAQQNIVERLTTLESTFGRSDGMLTEVLGTSLRGSE